jgi:hypothetical protein
LHGQRRVIVGRLTGVGFNIEGVYFDQFVVLKPFPWWSNVIYGGDLEVGMEQLVLQLVLQLAGVRRVCVCVGAGLDGVHGERRGVHQQSHCH